VIKFSMKLYIGALIVVLYSVVHLANACEKSVDISLEINQQKWSTMGWVNYSFVVKRQCFCSPEYRRTTRVEVQNSKVVNANYVEDNKSVSEEVLAELYTIKDWFRVIKDSASRNADHLYVIYHTELGYPEKIEIDMRELRADDEQTVFISDVIKQ